MSKKETSNSKPVLPLEVEIFSDVLNRMQEKLKDEKISKDINQEEVTEIDEESSPQPKSKPIH